MATPNYSYEKRQRELAKKRKTEEKRARKAGAGREDAPAQSSDAPDALASHDTAGAPAGSGAVAALQD